MSEWNTYSNLSQQDELFPRTWATQEGLRLRAAPPAASPAASDQGLQPATSVPQNEDLAPRI